METLCVLFTIAAIYGYKAHLLDAMNTYVGSQIDKWILMIPPEGVEHLPGQVCKILQSLYSLKQSGRLWNLKIASHIEKIGFKPTTVDSSVFINE